jgi:hypothetical protein
MLGDVGVVVVLEVMMPPSIPAPPSPQYHRNDFFFGYIVDMG